ncbi:hypothetical protein QTP88_029288 [Uroleucon formosanum]
MKKFGDGSTRLASKGREQAIADYLFPAAAITKWDTMPSPSVRNISDNFDPDVSEQTFDLVAPEFTVDELIKATKMLSSGKAEGSSGILNKILKRIVLAQPRATLNIYNKCLTKLTFPSIWKKAKLVLLHKGPGKPVEAPSSFRPIFLLDTPDKLLERLIFQRLDSHLDSRRTGRPPNQFGFRERHLNGDGTRGSHRISNACNTGQLEAEEALCPVPQGAQLVGFNDDLAVVGVAKTSELLENLLNPVLAKIDDWMTTRGIQLAHHKTEAVMLIKKWAYNPPQ